MGTRLLKRVATIMALSLVVSTHVACVEWASGPKTRITGSTGSRAPAGKQPGNDGKGGDADVENRRTARKTRPSPTPVVLEFRGSGQ